MDNLKITYQSPATLQPRATNPRTHSRKQIRQIADSIERFGFTNPVLIDDCSRIIAGHGRVEAATLLGMEKVPTIRLEDLTEAEIRAYVIADNKLAENAGWDRELLAIELQGLIELDFSIELTGFDIAEIDFLLDGEAEAKAPDHNIEDDETYNCSECHEETGDEDLPSRADAFHAQCKGCHE